MQATKLQLSYLLWPVPQTNLLSETDWTMHDAREYDTIVSTGEQVTVGLYLYIAKYWGGRRSWLGWQIPIKTDEVQVQRELKKLKRLI